MSAVTGNALEASAVVVGVLIVAWLVGETVQRARYRRQLRARREARRAALLRERERRDRRRRLGMYDKEPR